MKATKEVYGRIKVFEISTDLILELITIGGVNNKTLVFNGIHRDKKYKIIDARLLGYPYYRVALVLACEDFDMVEIGEIVPDLEVSFQTIHQEDIKTMDGEEAEKIHGNGSEQPHDIITHTEDK